MVFVKHYEIRSGRGFRLMEGRGLGDFFNSIPVKDIMNKGVKKLFDKGKDYAINYYDNNKEKIHSAIKEKAGDVAKKLIDKATEKAPEPVQKQLVKNRELIDNVSKKYINDLINKGDKKYKSYKNNNTRVKKGKGLKIL